MANVIPRKNRILPVKTFHARASTSPTRKSPPARMASTDIGRSHRDRRLRQVKRPHAAMSIAAVAPIVHAAIFRGDSASAGLYNSSGTARENERGDLSDLRT